MSDFLLAMLTDVKFSSVNIVSIITNNNGGQNYENKIQVVINLEIILYSAESQLVIEGDCIHIREDKIILYGSFFIDPPEGKFWE